MKKKLSPIIIIMLVALYIIPTIDSHAATGDFIFKWGTQGSGDGQFIYPEGLAFDGSGNLYVVDAYNHRIQVFDPSGTYLRQWGSFGYGNGLFNYPRDVAADESGEVYVADERNKLIQVFNSYGTFLRQWTMNDFNGIPWAHGQPWGIALNGSVSAYVAAPALFLQNESGVLVYDSQTGNLLDTWGSPGSGDGDFYGPHRMVLDSAGNVYVADTGNHRIQVFEANGNYLGKWGSEGTGDGQFNQPFGLAIDGKDNVYVADFYNHRIQVFDSSGNFIEKWGSSGSGDGQFEYPIAVAVDVSGNGNVYVADSYNHRIQVFEPVRAELSCNGFEAPMDKTISVKKKNRVLPLKMILTDGNGVTVTDLDIDSPPIVEVDFTGGDPTNPPEEAFLHAGQGDEGNQFVFNNGKWRFNLKTSNFSGSGTYMIKAVSGDPSEYVIDPTCMAEFVIQ